MALNIDHFHLVFRIRQDSNPQPIDRESSLLTTRPDLQPSIFLFMNATIPGTHGRITILSVKLTPYLLVSPRSRPGYRSAEIISKALAHEPVNDWIERTGKQKK